MTGKRGRQAEEKQQNINQLLGRMLTGGADDVGGALAMLDPQSFVAGQNYLQQQETAQQKKADVMQAEEDERDLMTLLSLGDYDKQTEYLGKREESIRERGGDPTDTQFLITLEPQERQRAISLLAQRSGVSLGSQDKPTPFVSDLMAAGMEPGSEEFKSAILEKHGKGKTIGYDVVEAVNPENGKTEYVQISRTDPNDMKFLGLEVPPDAATMKAKTLQETQDLAKYEEAQKALGHVERMLESPSLKGGWTGGTGIGSAIFTWPGTDKADFEVMHETLTSKQFTTEVSKMVGMGSLSDTEGKKIAAAAESLELRMSPEAYREALIRIKESLSTIKPPGTYKNDEAEEEVKTVNWSDIP
jgi:hypothetical protein